MGFYAIRDYRPISAKRISPLCISVMIQLALDNKGCLVFGLFSHFTLRRSCVNRNSLFQFQDRSRPPLMPRPPPALTTASILKFRGKHSP